MTPSVQLGLDSATGPASNCHNNNAPLISEQGIVGYGGVMLAAVCGIVTNGAGTRVGAFAVGAQDFE